MIYHVNQEIQPTDSVFLSFFHMKKIDCDASFKFLL